MIINIISSLLKTALLYIRGFDGGFILGGFVGIINLLREHKTKYYTYQNRNSNHQKES